MRTPSVLRRLIALVPATLMVLAGLSPVPTASAAPSDDYSTSYEFEIHENKTIDITQVRRGEGFGSESSCNSEDVGDGFDDGSTEITVEGDGENLCVTTVKGIPLREFNNSIGASITHESGSFTFTMQAFGRRYTDVQITVKVTFPGSVSEVSGDGNKSGNTAMWESAQSETSALTAKGADHDSSRKAGGFGLNSPLSIILIIALALAAAGGVTSLILIRKRRARTGAPGYPQPRRGGPGKAPGLDAAQPGYHAHPGVQQPYNHQSGYGPGPQPGYGQPGYSLNGQPGCGQPDQQPHNPDGQQ